MTALTKLSLTKSRYKNIGNFSGLLDVTLAVGYFVSSGKLNNFEGLSASVAAFSSLYVITGVLMIVQLLMACRIRKNGNAIQRNVSGH